VLRRAGLALLVAAAFWAPPLWWSAKLPTGLGCAPSGNPAELLRYVVAGGLLAEQPPAEPSPLEGKNPQIVIDAVARRLYLLADGAVYAEFPVAVGTPATPTPIGHWQIVKKSVWGGAFGARWMQLSMPWGTYGIHGTNNPGSIGSRASHGCVRMFNRDVVQLYALVPVGTPVTIRGNPVARFGEVRRVIVPSLLGSDVVQLQEKLGSLGLYSGPVTGVYTGASVAAVKVFQVQHDLKPTGVVDAKTYDLLGLTPLSDDPTLRPGQAP
jgi:hypothetical protein